MPIDDGSSSDRPLIQNAVSFFWSQQTAMPGYLGPNDLDSWVRDIGPIAYTLFPNLPSQQNESDSVSSFQASDDDRPLR